MLCYATCRASLVVVPPKAMFPDLGSLLLVESTGHRWTEGREPAVEGRATRLGLRREDESRMRPLQRLRRPWGKQEGKRSGAQDEVRGKEAWARFAAQSLDFCWPRSGCPVTFWLGPDLYAPALFPPYC